MTVGRILSSLSLWLVLVGIAPAQESDAKKPDTFFAGTVLEWTSGTITVSRVVLGKKTEKRSFRITPDTKVEGKMRTKVRVTVRYIADDDGDTATLIVVRAATDQKK